MQQIRRGYFFADHFKLLQGNLFLLVLEHSSPQHFIAVHQRAAVDETVGSIGGGFGKVVQPVGFAFAVHRLGQLRGDTFVILYI